MSQFHHARTVQILDCCGNYHSWVFEHDLCQNLGTNDPFYYAEVNIKNKHGFTGYKRASMLIKKNDRQYQLMGTAL